MRAALERAGNDDKKNAEETMVVDPLAGQQEAAVDPKTKDNKPVQAEVGDGRLNLSTEPAVDVYEGSEHLGRTPLSAKLPSGTHKLRFTDKETGINIYKTYRVHAGVEARDHVRFGTSELIVEAPDGASILLNSRVLGTAPLDPVKIYEGSYSLKVTLDGKSWANVFEAPAGRKINYRVTLKDWKNPRQRDACVGACSGHELSGARCGASNTFSMDPRCANPAASFAPPEIPKRAKETGAGRQ